MPKYSAITEADVSLSAATAKSVLGVHNNTSTARAGIEVVTIGIGFNGSSATAEPVDVVIRRCTTAGTGGTACTENSFIPGAAAPAAYGQYNITGEPSKDTAGLIAVQVHPQGGIFVVQYARGEGIELNVGTDDGIVIECTAPATVSCRAWMEWWE